MLSAPALNRPRGIPALGSHLETDRRGRGLDEQQLRRPPKSHAADAVRTLAMGLREQQPRIDSILERRFSTSRLLHQHGSNISWMSV